MIEEREEPRGYRRRGEAFWRRALLAQRESGSTQADFCRRNGLSLSTFQRWRRRIEEAAGEPTIGVTASRRPAPPLQSLRNCLIRSRFPESSISVESRRCRVSSRFAAMTHLAV